MADLMIENVPALRKGLITHIRACQRVVTGIDAHNTTVDRIDTSEIQDTASMAKIDVSEAKVTYQACINIVASGEYIPVDGE
ncbi:unnamed protein product [marine sediment metagenome]|uniref:Uncharacterized protein n=1 Tax=marine sediment metagenome TaxID=412755 RepID=X0SMG9_9ZZZZ